MGGELGKISLAAFKAFANTDDQVFNDDAKVYATNSGGLSTASLGEKAFIKKSDGTQRVITTVNVSNEERSEHARLELVNLAKSRLSGDVITFNKLMQKLLGGKCTQDGKEVDKMSTPLTKREIKDALKMMGVKLKDGAVKGENKADAPTTAEKVEVPQDSTEMEKAVKSAHDDYHPIPNNEVEVDGDGFGVEPPVEGKKDEGNKVEGENAGKPKYEVKFQTNLETINRLRSEGRGKVTESLIPPEGDEKPTSVEEKNTSSVKTESTQGKSALEQTSEISQQADVTIPGSTRNSTKAQSLIDKKYQELDIAGKHAEITEAIKTKGWYYNANERNARWELNAAFLFKCLDDDEITKAAAEDDHGLFTGDDFLNNPEYKEYRTEFIEDISTFDKSSWKNPFSCRKGYSTAVTLDAYLEAINKETDPVKREQLKKTLMPVITIFADNTVKLSQQDRAMQNR